MAEQQQIQVTMDPNGYYITGVNILATDEEFAFLITSQNQSRQFLSSPKHTKRILLLLQKTVGEFEAKNGEIQTSLPAVTTQTNSSKVGFQTDK